jgi:hypothetical protein
MHPANEPDPLDTVHGSVAFEFARALAEGQFEKAHRMLAPSLRDDLQPASLQSEYESMFSYAGETKPNVDRALGTMLSWPGKEDSDIGWAVVAISGPDSVDGGIWNEGVAVVVAEVNGQPLIRAIVWGRP